MKKTAVKTFKDFFGSIHKSDFKTLSQFKESATLGWLGFLFLCLAITWLTTFSVSNIPDKVEVGMVVKRNIRADRNISIVNEEETDRDREAAASKIIPVFDYDEIVPENAPAKIKPVLSKPIVADRETLFPYRESGLVLRRFNAPSTIPHEDQEILVKDVGSILTVDQAKKGFPPSFYKWISPNTTFDLKETEVRRNAAMRSVKEKTITYQPGDFILRAGTKLEPHDVQLLTTLKKARGLGNKPIRLFGTFLFVALSLGATFYFSERYIKSFLPARRDYFLMGFVVVVTLFILRVSLLLIGAIHEAFFYDLPRSALFYAIPIAGGVMLVRMVLSAEVSLIMAVLLSLLAGLTVGSGVDYTTFCLISGIAACSAIAKADHRAAIMSAGLWTGLINALVVLGIYLIQTTSFEAIFDWDSLLSYLGFALLGGILSSIFVLVATPIIESLLGYATDIKLLELANLNHPLLKELIVRAPGTYHHSHIVGILAEAAAEAIGANSLLARVSAYYHDIGKMKKPNYYIENTAGGSNKHEHLSPHMSALIVASHVKEGIALAKEHKLPESIINMIPEHHGTKQIGFFYEKAKEQANPDLHNIEEKDFRYPGPKPQSREAGILMMADGAEAAVRALKEKTSARIQQTVEKMIDNSFAEAQLDECDLTLKDLHEIAKAFTRILIGMYHQRIEYANDSSDTSAPAQKVAAPETPEFRETNVRPITFPKR